MPAPILVDLVIIFALSLPVLLICSRLKIPAIVGFLVTGILVGPGMLGLISAISEVHVLADIGVILLLFAIGIEFSLENLLRIRRIVLVGGGLQVLISILVTFGLGAVFGLPLPAALFAGMLVAQSSTVVTLRVLSERAELETTHGKSAVGVSIFQDITALPLLISIPVLAGATGTTGPELGILALKILGILVFIYAAARWIVPKFLHLVARTRVGSQANTGTTNLIDSPVQLQCIRAGVFRRVSVGT